MATNASAYLVFTVGTGYGKVEELFPGSLLRIGRSPKNNVVLRDDLSSRDHAEVYFADDRWYVRDLESLNGTKLNGDRVSGDVALTDGDQVVFGQSHFHITLDPRSLP